MIYSLEHLNCVLMICVLTFPEFPTAFAALMNMNMKRHLNVLECK